MVEVDPTFTALPLQVLADAALARARTLGAEHADVRVERIRSQDIAVRDHVLSGMHDGEALGMAVRVVHQGTWGFAAGADLDPGTAAALAEQAVQVARVSKALAASPVRLADEPVHHDRTWVSEYRTNPFDVPVPDKVALLVERSERVLAHPQVTHVTATLQQVQENTFYADSAGTSTTQQRVRVAPEVQALGVDPAAGFETMRTLAAPAGRGYEYVTGEDGVHDWSGELDGLGDLLAERLRAPSVEPGRYDLVIDPTNLWLTLHESVGHATELDRALGYEADYAGTSFATPDQVGALRYGSELMTVTGDRTTPHGLATVGYDHEGVAAQRFDLVREGRLVGFQLDRSSALLLPGSPGRSNGCAFAESPTRFAIQRMANVSLQPVPDGPGLDDLVADVDDGLYVVGDKSWSIDMQRYNFQFTAQRFVRIRRGRLAGQVKDAAYQGRTPEFWASLAGVGGPQTWWLGGTFTCGKAQPGQGAPVSHGSPVTLFRGVNVLNTLAEGGR